MTGQYRFLRTRGGITAFASVTVASSPAADLGVSWHPGIASHLHRLYQAAVEEGVSEAYREHQKRGGEPQSVEVLELLETTSDTKPDAVKCAAGIAAWKAWGWAENDVSIAQLDGKWIVTYSPGK